jgi:hypothetical protein
MHTSLHSETLLVCSTSFGQQQALFNKFLVMVGPKLFKKDTKMRRAIPVGKILMLQIIKLKFFSNYFINKIEQRLALTLRFLASGDCMRSLSYSG